MSSDKNFWLIAIEESWLSVALIINQPEGYKVAAIGPKIVWSGTSESLVTAIDSSLSSAANQIGLPPEDEPQKAAFILPPFWVGADAKIVPERLKQVEHICKSLAFRPMGFIANDEAIVEEANLREGLPVSFVLVNISHELLTVSLVYLGKVKSRIRKVIDQEFTPELIDTALSDMGVGNALPPQIVVFGDYTVHVLNLIKGYNWIGKKNPQTFLHLPEVDIIEFERLFAIYSQTIISQIDVTSVITTSQSQLNSYETVEVVPEDASADIEPVVNEEDDTAINDSHEIESSAQDPDPIVFPQTPTSFVAEPQTDITNPPQNDSGLVEVSAADFGFSSVPTIDSVPSAPASVVPPVPVLNSFPPDLNKFVDSLPQTPRQETIFTPPPKVKSTRPPFKLKLKVPNGMGVLAAFLFIVLLVLIVPIFVSSAQITLFVTPYSFSKTVTATLDSTTTSPDVSNKIIPVTKRQLEVAATATTRTTGTKTTGDKAKGQIVIFNKLDKSQSIAKGTVLLDGKGNKFELLTSVVVTPSTFDLNTGTITTGQTRTMAAASDIGSQFNIAKDATFTIQNIPTSSLVAKSDQAFTGGFSKQIAAVAPEDKASLQTQLTDEIKKNTQAKIQTDLANVNGVIADSIKIEQNRVEYNREVGEESDELIGNITATVSVFVFDSSLKPQLINTILSQDDNFDKADIKPDDFQLNFKISKLDTDKATAQLQVVGKALPKIDTLALQQNLALKPVTQLQQVVKKQSPRVYDFNTKQTFVGLLKILPFDPKKITLDVKTEN